MWMVSYYDRGDADTGEHLLDQPISVIQGFHNQAILSGHLQKDTFVRALHSWGKFVCVCERDTYGAPMKSLIVQKILLQDCFLTGKLLLGHFLYRATNSILKLDVMAG